jgi:mannose-6-phosphate isomerase-like protein (cupin superfamily)
MDEARPPSPRYPGPLALATAHSKLHLAEPSDAAFTREGLRPDSEYRDLGLATATDGRIGAKHIRAIAPFPGPTGWHWHDMTGHFIYVLRGWIRFRFAGVEGEVTVRAGASLSQPAGVAHNVVARSDDLELIEINLPAEYATIELSAAKDAAQP